MPYIIALDQGTTSSRAIVFDDGGRVTALAQREFEQIYPEPGWVEHDPQAILDSQIATAIEALKMADVDAAQVSALGLTNQRETTIIWERATGQPIHNAIVWQDRRTSAFCTSVRQDQGGVIREKTGLEVDAYFSASKIGWLLDNVPGARARAERGELAFGTIDTWLVWNLTNGRLHITDVSNASRTMLFNINSLTWDEELLRIFNVPRELLPEVRGSSEIYGEVEMPNELRGLAIAGIAGDQQAALFGQACFAPGSVKNTYGTGCFMLQNTGEAAKDSRNNLLTTVGWQIGGRTEYAIEGSVFIGGAVVQWLRDSLSIIDRSSDVEKLAASVTDAGGVYFVPAFAGLGAPHWDQNARGLLIGLTRGTGKAHIARAALESIAYQTADLLDAMRADSNTQVLELKVDGGATANEMLMQFQADVLQVPILRSAVAETTALGAAYLAGLAVGVWRSRAELAEHWNADRRYEPKMPHERAADLRSRWTEAVTRSKNWIA